ncbi:MAG: hypothetical protein LC667_01070 [Thioalkalivibrio sp.]|nr:hypothetical protein [Thioalkalivibrio sp.]
MIRTLTALLAMLAMATPALANALYERQGVGDDFFDIDLGVPSIALLTHDGRSNFQVLAYAADGGRDVLVNEIGVYQGTRPLGFSELPVEIEIKADGAWTLTVLPLDQAVEPGTSLAGRGDMVLDFRGVDGRALVLTHDGSSNFMVLAWGDRRSALVNEIGAYSGRLRLAAGTLFLEIRADGNWSLQIE